LNLISI